VKATSMTTEVPQCHLLTAIAPSPVAIAFQSSAVARAVLYMVTSPPKEITGRVADQRVC
jgi:hypothetical protein